MLNAPWPDAIFNVTFGADLAKLVREGNQRNLFPRIPVVSLLSGEPEYLDVPGRNNPRLDRYWLSVGSDRHARACVICHQLQALQENPKVGSVVGYATMQAIFAAIARPRARIVKTGGALRGLQFTTPLDRLNSAQDQQSTMGPSSANWTCAAAKVRWCSGAMRRQNLPAAGCLCAGRRPAAANQ